jgi:hypothetical protein
MAKKNAAKGLWGEVRKAGGSIIGTDGSNLTADSAGAAAFSAALGELCGEHSTADLLSTIEQGLARAAEIAAMNAIPTTDPKCASKPIFRLQTGCSIECEMIPRNKNEQLCS